MDDNQKKRSVEELKNDVLEEESDLKKDQKMRGGIGRS